MDTLNVNGNATVTRRFAQNFWSAPTASGVPLRSHTLKDFSQGSFQSIGETFQQRGDGDILFDTTTDDAKHQQTLATMISEAPRGTFHSINCKDGASSNTVATAIQSTSLQAFCLTNNGPSAKLHYTTSDGKLTPAKATGPAAAVVEPYDFVHIRNLVDPSTGEAGNMNINMSSVSATSDAIVNKALLYLYNEHPSLEKLICKISASSFTNEGISSDHHTILAQNAKVAASTSSLRSNVGCCVKAIASEVVHSAMQIASGPKEPAMDLLNGATQTLSASSVNADDLVVIMDDSSKIETSALRAAAPVLAKGGLWYYSPNGNYTQGTAAFGTTLVEQAASPVKTNE